MTSSPSGTIKVEIKRQSNPNTPATTEKFEVPYRPGMNITSLLGEIALNPTTITCRRPAATPPPPETTRPKCK
jgi:succinate dehydrogenase / fumarate reductase iron-sulfur subunit